MTETLERPPMATKPSPKLLESLAELREQGIQFLPIAKLKPWAGNPNRHDPGTPRLVRLMQRFGWTQPVIIRRDADPDDRHEVSAGHGRAFEAAVELGLEEVPVIFRNFTAHESHASGLADNKAPEFSLEDPAALQAAIDSLIANDGLDDVMDAGWTSEALDELAASVGGGGEGEPPPEPPTPDPPKDPITNPGDVWLMGDHRLMCGDSTSTSAVSALMAGALANMMFTDPPYGYSYQSNHQTTHGMLENDDKILDFLPCADAALRDDSAVYLCASHQTAHKWRPLLDVHFTHKNLIVWKKNNWSMGDLAGAFAGQHELIFFAHKGRVTLNGERSRDVWEFDRDPPEHHPTQKPVELVRFACEKTSARGDVVLDLFGGSGTTLLACEQIGRSCRMMELSPAYCDVIVQRWEAMTGGKATLEASDA